MHNLSSLRLLQDVLSSSVNVVRKPAMDPVSKLLSARTHTHMRFRTHAHTYASAHTPLLDLLMSILLQSCVLKEKKKLLGFQNVFDVLARHIKIVYAG